MKVLYSGFDLCDRDERQHDDQRAAPTILAMFLNCAIDQQMDKFRAENGREPTAAEPERSRRKHFQLSRTVQADI